MTKREEYAAIYNKNAEKMAVLKALIKAAQNRGDKEAARKYRAEYTDLKAEIDAKLFGYLAEQTV